MAEVRKNWYVPHDHNDGIGPHQHFPVNVTPGHDHTGVELVPFPERAMTQPEQESDGARLARMGVDAPIWAQEFVRLHKDKLIMTKTNEENWWLGTMIGWFANAIEAGRSAGWQAGLDSERGSGLS